MEVRSRLGDNWPTEAARNKRSGEVGVPAHTDVVGVTTAGTRKHITESIDKSLTRIGTDYVDIYFCHRPDPEVPIEEVVRAMTELINRGKVFYWGTSEWSAAEIMEAYSVAREYHLIPLAGFPV